MSAKKKAAESTSEDDGAVVADLGQLVPLCHEIEECEADIASPKFAAAGILPGGMSLMTLLAVIKFVRELLKSLPERRETASASAALIPGDLFEDARAFVAALRAGDYLTVLRLFLKFAQLGVDLYAPQFSAAKAVSGAAKA